MSLRRLFLLGAVAALALACTRTVEPGVYTVQGGFVRVYVDSLGATKALMYRDTSVQGGGNEGRHLWARPQERRRG